MKVLYIAAAFIAMVMAGPAVNGAEAAQAAVDITITGLESMDLAAFELDVNYDPDQLTFGGYTLTDELGSFTEPADGPDAGDWSLGDDGQGTVSLAVFSYLTDFSTQSDAFTLATLSFSGEESALSTLSLSILELSDASGDAIAFTVDGTAINATTAVPIPAAAWLMVSGLLGIVGIGIGRRPQR